MTNAAASAAVTTIPATRAAVVPKTTVALKTMKPRNPWTAHPTHRGRAA